MHDPPDDHAGSRGASPEAAGTGEGSTFSTLSPDGPGSSARASREDDVAADEDMRLLARHGVDAVLERLGHGGDEEPLELPRRGGRSPVLSFVVLLVGIYMLGTMWADVRYWLRSSEPEDLGHVAEILDRGRMPPGLDNHYVRIRGTPDVQNAVRLETRKRFIGYRRIVEAGGSLFVAIPRDKSQTVTNTFEGAFEGRMRRLGDHGAYPWLEQFFEGEPIVRIVDLDADDLLRKAGRGPFVVRTADGEDVDLEPDDTLRIVARLPVATVQIGKDSVPDRAAAEARVAALGRPYAAREAAKKPFYVFVVAVEEEEDFDALARRLESGMKVENRADPRQGVMVLPRIAAYRVAPGDLAAEGDRFLFPYGENKASPGFVEEGGRLVEKLPKDGLVRVPRSRVKAVRLERRVRLDRDGYVLLHGERPSSLRMHGILWFVVFGLVVVNGGSLLLWWRRRRASA